MSEVSELSELTELSELSEVSELSALIGQPPAATKYRSSRATTAALALAIWSGAEGAHQLD